MMRLVLCILIILCCAFSGFLKASVFSSRIRILQDLMTNLNYLQSEMEYSMEPVPMLLKRIGESRRDQEGGFFLEAEKLLSEKREKNLYDAWEKAIDMVYEENGLSKEDKKILKVLGYELGKTDMENQKRLFEHCFCQLKQQMTQAKEEAAVKGRMYRSLGISMGILIAVVFL